MWGCFTRNEIQLFFNLDRRTQVMRHRFALATQFGRPACQLHRPQVKRSSSSSQAVLPLNNSPQHATTQIELNENAVDEVGVKHRRLIGPRTVVVSTPTDRAENPHVQRVLARLRGVGIECGTFSMLERYPTTQALDEGAQMAKRMGAHSIIGVGGGGALDLAKGMAVLACTGEGRARDYLRVFHKEKELSDQRLPVVTVPTTASAGGGGIGPQCLALYEAEEALVPLHARDLAPDLAIVDPTLTVTLPLQAERSMALGAWSVCFDALLCGSVRGVLANHAMADLILGGASELGRGLGMAAGNDKGETKRRHLAQGSVAAGRLLRLVKAPPIQSLARCLAPLFPLATYSQLTAVLLRSYLAVLADRRQQGELGGEAWNEALLLRMGAATCSARDGPGANGGGLLEMAEWAWEESQKAGLRSLLDYRALDKETKDAETLAGQVMSVLALFEVEGGPALEADVVRDVLEVSLGT